MTAGYCSDTMLTRDLSSERLRKSGSVLNVFIRLPSSYADLLKLKKNTKEKGSISTGGGGGGLKTYMTTVLLF